MKRCCTCKEIKPLTDFHKRSVSPDGFTRYCRACQKQRNKIHYSEHKEQYMAVARNSRKVRDAAYRAWKSTLKCQLCSCSDTECLDFHHVDSKKKEISISAGIHEVSSKRLINELTKCAVVCANCHRKIHAGTIRASLVTLDVSQIPSIK